MNCTNSKEHVPACEAPKDEILEIIQRNWDNKNYQYVEVIRRQQAKLGKLYDFIKPVGFHGRFVLRDY